MTFDEPTIHNLAAEMFWRMADEIGVFNVNKRVLETKGRCLLDHRFDSDLWREYPLPSLPDGEAGRVLEAVAVEAFDFTRDQQNMIGQVFLEDWQSGRSPSAANVDTQALARTPSFTCDQSIERLGRLCLRHPLPAIVFADREPAQGVIQVDDTATALGFDLPMFLTIAGCQRINDATVVLTGYFQIPVPDVATGNQWNHVIQNSSRAVSGVIISLPEGQFTFAYRWDAPPKRGWSWRRQS